MRASSSMSSILQKSGSMSMTELPNLPGVKKDLAAINPKLYAQFKASTVSIDDESIVASVEAKLRANETSASLEDFFENPSKFEILNNSINQYPDEGVAYNDVYGGRYSIHSQKKDILNKSRSLPYCSLDTAPSFVRNNDTDLRFLGYFEETVIDKGVPTLKARSVEILFHAHDNTLEVTEMKVGNIGIVQGKILKRHQVPKALDDGSISPESIFTAGDFFAGAKLNIYSRDYIIVDCDNWTRAYYEDLDMPFGDAVPLPSYTYKTGSLRPEKVEGVRSITQKFEPPSVKGAGFYAYGQKTLRFYGVYDDTHSLYGDKIFVKLHYFLADNTMEVNPENSRNSGRDQLGLPRLSKNGIPKSDDKFALTNANNTILQDGDPVEMYHWKQLQIGMAIQTASIKVKILDADPFTRRFYEQNGLPLDDAIILPKIESSEYNMTEVMSKSYSDATFLPEECVGMNTIGLQSEVPRDGEKLVKYSGMILRYVAKLDNPKIEDVNRVFIIQIYLEDDNIQIMEPPVRNSGFKGGVFLQKQAVISSESYRSVEPTDFYIGVNIQLLSHRFIVYDADEFTQKYMEGRGYMWTMCDMSLIKSKIAGKGEVVTKQLLKIRDLSSKLVTLEELIDVLMDPVLDLGFVKQEVFTFFRQTKHDLDIYDLDTIPLTAILNIAKTAD